MNFIPQEDYQGLLAQAKAMHRIIEAMEKSKSIQGKAVDDLTRQLLICGQDHLESEREANQLLTDQVLKLEQERDRLKVQVEAFRPYRDNHHDLMRHMAEHDAQVIEQFSADLSTITNEMKTHCIGEFSWKEDADYYDENGDIVVHVATRTVPWDLCKEIYKKMLSVKLRQKTQEEG